jgi:hypothetical protein
MVLGYWHTLGFGSVGLVRRLCGVRSHLSLSLCGFGITHLSSHSEPNKGLGVNRRLELMGVRVEGCGSEEGGEERREGVSAREGRCV